MPASPAIRFVFALAVGLLSVTPVAARDIGNSGEPPMAEKVRLPVEEAEEGGGVLGPVVAASVCNAEINGDGVTDFASVDASAVRLAVVAVAPNGTVKIAGYCSGVATQGGTTQTALITHTITLAGGYTTTDWTTYNPAGNPTTLDALLGGRVISAPVAATLRGFTVTQGYISSTLSLMGGGIYAAAALSLTDMIVTGNSLIGTNGTKQGGGLYAGGPAVVYSVTFSNNVATSEGGGLFADSTLALSGAQFLANTARQGGALYLIGPTATEVVNTLFARNSATTNGAAIYVYVFGGGLFSLIHATIVSPTAPTGAPDAVYVQGGTAYITNSIVASHTTGIQQGGGTVTQNNNLFFGNTNNTVGAVNGGPSPVGDPGFYDTLNYTLTAASAAIDIGLNAGIPSDYFGNSRPQGGGPDAGYAESPYTYVAPARPNTCFTEYTGDGVTDYSSADASAVRQALAAVAPNGTVKVAGYCAGVVVQGPVLAPGTQLGLITKTMAVRGGYTTTDWTTYNPAGNPTTLDALAGGRVLAANVAATLQGFTVTGGYISSTLSMTGGGISAAAALTLSDMIVAGNSLTGTSGTKRGGGVYAGGPTVVYSATFSNNVATSSGGGLNAFNTLALSGTQFFANTAAAGGALYLSGSTPKKVVNTLFARNSATTNGAAIYVANPALLSLIHTTIVSPTAPTGAPEAVYVRGTVYITNTLIATHAIGIARAGGTASDWNSLFAGVATPYSGTITSVGGITGTAGFVDASADDYHLGTGSAALNAGIDAGVYTDFEGQARPFGAGYDIGFDESVFGPRAFLPMVVR